MTAEDAVLDRRATPHGEVALRRVGPHWEIIVNGVSCMSTAWGGRSEARLVAATLTASGRGRRVLLGGLGLGCSLRAALAVPTVAEVVVVEREPAVVDWHRGLLRELSEAALDDPRVQVVVADLVDLVAAGRVAGAFDAVCVDVDNGPHRTVSPRNRWLYGREGVDRLAALLAGDGALGVWSAHPAPDLAAVLATRFARVHSELVPVPRGQPDLVLVGSQRRRGVAG